MHRANSEAARAINANTAKMLRDLADIVEKGEYYDIEIGGLGQFYTIFGEPIRRQYTFRIVTEEVPGNG